MHWFFINLFSALDRYIRKIFNVCMVLWMCEVTGHFKLVKCSEQFSIPTAVTDATSNMRTTRVQSQRFIFCYESAVETKAVHSVYLVLCRWFIDECAWVFAITATSDTYTCCGMLIYYLHLLWLLLSGHDWICLLYTSRCV